MIELTLADGKEIDIPDNSILLFEEMDKDTNPNFPDGRSFIMYRVGNEILTAVLKNSFEDVLFETKATSNRKWLRLSRKDNLRIAFPAKMVQSRLAVEDGCVLRVQVGENVYAYLVNETRRQIKKWSEVSPVAEERNEQ